MASGDVYMSLLDTAGNLAGSAFANQADRQNAAAQMNFQSQMSSTAHQREVIDLEKAGLNPILSAMGGSGASTPAGSNWSAQSAPVTIGKDYLNYINSAQQRALQAQQIAASQKDVEKTTADIANVNEATNTQRTQQTVNSALAKQATASAGREISQQHLNSAMAAKTAIDALNSAAMKQGIDADSNLKLYKSQALQKETAGYREPVIGDILGVIDYMKTMVPFLPQIPTNP